MGRKKVFEAAGLMEKSEARAALANTMRAMMREEQVLKGNQLAAALKAAGKAPASEAEPTAPPPTPPVPTRARGR